MLLPFLLTLLASGTTPTLALQRYEIDAPKSQVGFDGSSTLHDFTGKTRAIGGELRADPLDPARLAGGVVWVEAKTIDTDNGSRDKEMRSVLDVEHHPRIEFRLDDVTGRLVQGRGEFRANGRFTIHGVEKPRTVAFKIEPLAPEQGGPAGALHVLGEARFKMTDHGLERPGVLFVKVADEVRVWLDLLLVPVKDPLLDALARPVEVVETFTPRGGKAAAWTKRGEEVFWRSGATRLWERRLAPDWILDGALGGRRLDPRTAAIVAPDEAWLEVLYATSKGPAWTTTIQEADGERTLSFTFGAETAARLPAWALAPETWLSASPLVAAR